MNNDSGSLIAQKRQLVASITEQERAAAGHEYRRHVNCCREIDIDPAPYGPWLVEWLECHRQPELAGIGGDDPVSQERRDYTRMYDGKRGYES